MSTELVLATNIVKLPLALLAAFWTVLLMREMGRDRRTLYWLFAASTELLLTVAVSAGYFGWERVTVLGYTRGEALSWPDSVGAAVLNVVFAHGCWLFILVAYRVWSVRGNDQPADMRRMARASLVSLVAIVLMVSVIGLLLQLK